MSINVLILVKYGGINKYIYIALTGKGRVLPAARLIYPKPSL
jgi:hypothetical protein